MLRALVSEIVLIDSNVALAEAEAADIADANALARPARIWAGDYEDAASAHIAIITAGAATHGSESRMSVLTRSAAIMSDCARSLRSAGFAGIIVVAANPVDVMAQVAFRNAGRPSNHVIGTGTLLDSSRLRQALAAKLDVAPSAIEALVIGEHGDSEVAAFSTVRVGGLRLDQFALPSALLDQIEIMNAVRDAGYRIVSGKGYTSFGVATAIVRICEVIIRNERTMLPVSTLLTGQFGIQNVYLSLPSILGADGVDRVLVPVLSDLERAALAHSAAVIGKAIAHLGTL